MRRRSKWFSAWRRSSASWSRASALLAVGGRGPDALSLGARVDGFVSALLMVLFFGRVARGLVAAMRGREVPTCSRRA
jgi:hypothetical protein